MSTLQQQISQRARSDVRAMCAKSPSFLALGPDEQFGLYKELCKARAAELELGTALERPGLAQAMARQASDLIDDRRHEGRGLDRAGERMADLVDTVDFPGFVGDLLRAVFDANMRVIVEQTDQYIELLKTATKSVAHYVNDIDDTAAFGYLAENNSDEFSFDFDEEDKDEEGNPKPVLTDKEGNRLDIGDNEVKARIMDAKIKMAQEQRSILRETISMGLSRIVVNKGTVKASVLFDVRSQAHVEKTDKAALRESSSTGGGGKVSTGLIGKIFGGASGGGSHSRKKSQISVSTAKSTADDEVTAKLAGSVEIEFKTDYFKLDNFAQMYGPQPAPQGAPGAPGVPPRA